MGTETSGSGVVDPIQLKGKRSWRREHVYEAVDTERAYQDAGKGNAARHEQKAMTVGEFICCMEEYVAKARAEWVKAGGVQPALHDVRKAVALGVQCMEFHGAPPRQ